MIFIVLIFKAMASSQIHKGVVTTVAESIRLPAAVLYSKRLSNAVQRGARVIGGAAKRKGAAPRVLCSLPPSTAQPPAATELYSTNVFLRAETSFSQCTKSEKETYLFFGNQQFCPLNYGQNY